jgi:hypothetical protein
MVKCEKCIFFKDMIKCIEFMKEREAIEAAIQLDGVKDIDCECENYETSEVGKDIEALEYMENRGW